jgi:FixJ family two-component response regulator
MSVLPGLSGFELYQRLLQSYSKLPVIFISGDDEPSGVDRARELGAVAYLAKPTLAGDFLDAITRALNLSGGTQLPKLRKCSTAFVEFCNL